MAELMLHLAISLQRHTQFLNILFRQCSISQYRGYFIKAEFICRALSHMEEIYRTINRT